MPLLALERVTKRFDGIIAVDDVSFAIDRGQVVGFLGPNGAGKSTTMRMITQYFEPDAGQVPFDDVPIADAGRDAKARIGFLPENNPLYGEMLVAEYLDFVAHLRALSGTPEAQAVDEAVAATGIETVYYRPIGELSKGFKQRVGLAAAILHRPDLLVLDEPTEGLDPNQRVESRRLIAALGRERTVLLSTHVLSEAQHMCSRLLIINRGKIVADGGAEALVSHTTGTHVDVEVAAANSATVESRLAALPGIHNVERRDATDGKIRVRITTAGGDDVRPAIFELAKTEGWTLFELHQEARSLEDLFRQLTATTDTAGTTRAADAPA